ncbi:P-loop NTPase fold protein [Aliikangiella coralliicola]|uniref:EVE domain-containing protein n=1 Tax=Aliikangiella coralliicola TaxID=2592383 RepID=A0A545U7J2_9GAMM|nr:P-loop NTPase fold protein [Aliikangiella coralliicola]TQV85373.1 EVE domain-containing protein [Aliikangiella coralliicola]
MSEPIDQTARQNNLNQDNISEIKSPMIPAPPRYWIFQAVPGDFDLAKEITVGKVNHWPLNRYTSSVHKGDFVYLWKSGKERGIYGWGIVEEEPTIENKAGMVNVRDQEKFQQPILHEELLNQGKKFRALTIIRNQTGTNFRVSSTEAEALNKVISNSNQRPPADPFKFEEQFFSAATLSDYRYSGNTSKIISAALKLALNNESLPKISPEHLIQLTISLALNSDSESTIFLRENLPTLSSLDLKYAESINWSEVTGFLESDSLLSTFVEPSVLALLDTARLAAVSSCRKERISLRHLIAAVIHGGSEEVQSLLTEMLQNADIDLDNTRQVFLTFVSQMWPNDNHTAWGDFLASNYKRDSRDLLALVNSDASKGRDFLNIKNDVNAFASLLAAKDANPPIAVGLFGDWGSGKTFFMNKLRDRIDEIAEESRKVSKEEETAFCKNIAQIEFNAWHYSESNLWASLTDHFFKELRFELTRIGYNDESYRALIEKLGFSSELQNAVTDKIKTIQDKRKKLFAEQNNAQIKRDELTGKLLSKIILKKNSDGKVELAEPFIQNSKDIKKLTDIDLTNEKIDDSLESVSTLISLLRRRKVLGNRLKNIFKGLLKYSSMGQRILFVILIVGIVSLFFVDSFQNIAGAVGQVIAAIASFFAVLNKPLKKAKGILNWVESISDEYDKAKDASYEVKIINKELSDSQAGLSKLLEEHPEIAHENFIKFVYERADSSDYDKHLGLLSTVRKDFERLNELMCQQKNAGSQSKFEQDSSLPSLDRIVLYIDDLDRCSHERVTQVLQAIHLILAFPLFMVVVGVDARWVGRSLKKNYPFLIHDNGEIKLRGDPNAASTDDYLEKIFQIPFWLKSIDGNMTGDLINGVVGVGADEGAKNIQTDNAPILDKAESGQKEKKAGADRLSSGEADTEDEEDSFHDELSDTENSLDLKPRSLDISEHELDYMKVLGGIVGRSPRTVKRFINLYRLLKASDERAHSISFSSQSGGFYAPMFLLAVLCGRPRVSEHFFSIIRNASRDSSLTDCWANNKEKDFGTGSITGSHWQAFSLSMDNYLSAGSNRHFSVGELVSWLNDVARYGYREWRI